MYKRDDKRNVEMMAHAQYSGSTQMGGLRPGAASSAATAAAATDDVSCSSSMSDTGSEQDWTWPAAAAKRTRMDFDDSLSPCASSSSSTQRQVTKKPDSSQKYGADDERRRVRRERNKQAAARCRQKRVDLTNSLVAETEALENEKVKLEKEIESLYRQTHELQFVLDSHSKRCQMTLDTASSTGVDSLPTPVDLTAVKTEKPDTLTLHRQIPRNLDATYETARPSSLSFALPGGGGNQFSGPAVTPGSLTLDFMADGHTGLTPITGLPSAAEVPSSIDCLPSNQTLMNL